MFGLKRKHQFSEPALPDSYTQLMLYTQMARQQEGGSDASSIVSAVAVFWGNVIATFKPERFERVLNRFTLSRIGYELVDKGECLFGIDVKDGEIQLRFAKSYDLQEDGYKLEFEMPGGDIRWRKYKADDVLHFRWDASGALKSRSPISPALRSLAYLVDDAPTLALSIPSTALVQFKDYGRDKATSRKSLQTELDNAKGKLKAIERPAEMRTNISAVASSTGNATDLLRVNPEYENSLVNLRQQVYESVCSVCGVPPALILGKALGGAHREAYRTFIHTGAQPLIHRLEAELSLKFDASVVLQGEELVSADIATRARAWASLVDKGKSAAEADAIVGF